MTEAEWLASTDPTPMLEFLRGKASDRKSRLFACACVQSIFNSYLDWCGPKTPFAAYWNLRSPYEGRWGDTLEEAYCFADQQEIPQELIASRRESRRLLRSMAYAEGDSLREHLLNDRMTELLSTPSFGLQDALAVSREVAKPYGIEVCERPSTTQRAIHANYLREIFGNPFRPITLNPSWLTSTVVSPATGIYKERAFDRLPILADALQDAGYDNEDILNHCRQPGEHVRGCFVLDLLLGKT